MERLAKTSEKAEETLKDALGARPDGRSDEAPKEQPRKFSTTPGTRDMLPPEAMRLSDVTRRVVERFRLHGFREVITPALEYAEVLQEPHLRDASFKLFDPDNQMLLLRPEMTTPIARLVAQRLKGVPTPHKLSYCVPVYRRAGVGRGQSAEFHQAGVEVVGSASPGEDAGGISLLMDVLQSVGLAAGEDFSVVLGQASFYRAFLEENAPEVSEELLGALANKDLVRVEELSGRLPAPVREAAREIPRIVGPAADPEVLERAGRYATGRAGEALENLREVLAYLEATGMLGGVILDLGLVGRYGYYTGTVYEVYARGLGFTVASGGRYDRMLERFGERMPATGFAISLERLLSVLPDDSRGPDLLLVGEAPETSALAGRLRALDLPTLHVAENLTPEEAARYAQSVGARRIAYADGGGLSVARADDPEMRFEARSLDEVAREVPA